MKPRLQRKVLYWGTWLACALCVPTPAWAALRPVGAKPQGFALQPRTHLYAHTLTFGIGIVPLDELYIGLAVHGGYTYRLSDLWAWEVLHAAYSFNFDTGLMANFAQIGAAVQVEQTQRARIFLGTHASATPLVGKMALFNRGLVHVQTHFLAGPGVVIMQRPQSSGSDATSITFYPALDLGLGVDLFVSHAVSIRLDVRDSIVFGHSVTNQLIASLAATVGFAALNSQVSQVPAL